MALSNSSTNVTFNWHPKTLCQGGFNDIILCQATMFRHFVKYYNVAFVKQKLTVNNNIAIFDATDIHQGMSYQHELEFCNHYITLRTVSETCLIDHDIQAMFDWLSHGKAHIDIGIYM